MKFVWVLCTFASLIFLMAGCVAVPIPVDYHSPGSRENVGEDTVNLFIPEETAIEDVMLKLGEPDNVSSDGKTITYGIEKTKLILIWGTFYLSGENYWEENYHLVLKFNDQGILAEAEFQEKDNYWRSSKDKYEYPFYYSFPYFVLLPDIPFAPDNDLVDMIINDDRTDKERHSHIRVYHYLDREVFIDPSESEIIRRIFVRKLSEIQERYKISTPQKYVININKFDCFCHRVQCEINNNYRRNVPIAETDIKLTLEYQGNEYQFSVRQAITKDFGHRWGKGYPVEEKLTESLQSALTEIEKSLERQVPIILKDHNNL